MDMNFHYFTVKTLAREAGFDEAEAQRIATYSEFIDDFTWITYIDCKNIPDDIKNDVNLDLYIPSILTLNLNFNPVMTGFMSIIDMAFLLLERTQRFTVSPFHFIPNAMGAVDIKAVRVRPTIVDNTTIIGRLLGEAKESFVNQTEPRQKSLMRIGMLLHTFADTYAHQMFSGYDSWVNDVSVTEVVNNITQENITASVQREIADEKARVASAADANALLPCIGHMWAGHTPDLTNVSFTMRYKQNKTDTVYQTYYRSNTDEFLTPCLHILNYLRACLNKPNISIADWAALSAKLRRGFLVEMPDSDVETRLAAHWRGIFADYSYFYSAKAVEDSFYGVDANDATPQDDAAVNSPFGKNYTTDFYRYNTIAETLLIQMYGPHPRKSWFN
jgi:hypothetical protein